MNFNLFVGKLKDSVKDEIEDIIEKVNEKLDEIDNESKANAGHVDNLREVNKELLERIKVNVQDDIDKQTGKCLVLLWVQNNFESVQIVL